MLIALTAEINQFLSNLVKNSHLHTRILFNNFELFLISIVVDDNEKKNINIWNRLLLKIRHTNKIGQKIH